MIGFLFAERIQPLAIEGPFDQDGEFLLLENVICMTITAKTCYWKNLNIAYFGDDNVVDVYVRY